MSASSKPTEAFPKRVRAATPMDLFPGLERLLATIDQLTTTIRQMDREVEWLCGERYPETEALRRVPDDSDCTRTLSRGDRVVTVSFRGGNRKSDIACQSLRVASYIHIERLSSFVMGSLVGYAAAHFPPILALVYVFDIPWPSPRPKRELVSTLDAIVSAGSQWLRRRFSSAA